MIAFFLVFLSLSTIGSSQEHLFKDYREDGLVAVLDDDPTLMTEQKVNDGILYVDEGNFTIGNLTIGNQTKTNVSTANGNLNTNSTIRKNQRNDSLNDGSCGYLIVRFMVLTAILFFFMTIILLIWYCGAVSPHKHKFPARVVVTPTAYRRTG